MSLLRAGLKLPKQRGYEYVYILYKASETEFVRSKIPYMEENVEDIVGIERKPNSPGRYINAQVLKNH